MQQNKHLDIGSEPSESSTSPQSLAEILQNLLLSDRIGYILFTVDHNFGHIHFRHDQLQHATTGVLSGEEALLEMLQWGEGTYALHEDTSLPPRTIHTPLEPLLLEAIRRSDQRSNPELKITAPHLSIPSQTAVDSLPKITIQGPSGESRTVELVQDYLHIGRHPGNEIVFDDASISSRHCVFIVAGNEVTLRDLNSTNGTLVNDEPISEKVLQVGDIIRLGNVILKFESKPKRPKLQMVDKTVQTEVLALRKKNRLRSADISESVAAIRVDPTSEPLPSAQTLEQRKNLILATVVIIIFFIALLAFFKLAR